MSSWGGRESDWEPDLSLRVGKDEGNVLAGLSKVPCTIWDVARLAGVSIATVSRVTSGFNNVTCKKAAKVLAAVSQLQYRPNAMAAELARGKDGNQRMRSAHRSAMAGMKTTMLNKEDHAPTSAFEYYGRHFDAKRTQEALGDTSALSEGLVNLSAPAGSSPLDHLKEICRLSSRPLPMKSLSEQLNDRKSVRVRYFHGGLGICIEQIVGNYPFLRWWIEKDGLVVAEEASEFGPIFEFDRIAGQLVIEHWKEGKLPAASLELIALSLDAECFKFLENLQPAPRKLISGYNIRHSSSLIMTFADAARHPQFKHSVLRRLYLARVRFKKALQLAQPIYIETL